MGPAEFDWGVQSGADFKMVYLGQRSFERRWVEQAKQLQVVFPLK